MKIVRFHDGTWAEVSDAEIFEVDFDSPIEEDGVTQYAYELIENDFDELLDKGFAKFLGNLESFINA